MGISRTKNEDSLTYLLLPFSEKYSKIHLENSKSWDNLKDSFCLDTFDNKGSQCWDIATQALRSNNSVSDVLYIEGHCDKGGDKLFSEDQQRSITAPDLAGLIANGILKPSWPGVIKIYGCHSGQGSSFLFWNYQSYVQTFADEMYNKHGYTYCSFWGYSAPNSYGKYTPDNNTFGAHKWADAKSGKRASQALVKITPKIKG
jgi:hypothetical protein